VEIPRKRDVARLGTDVRAHTDDRLSDAPDEETVRAQPVRICVPVKKDFRFRRYLRQLGVRIIAHVSAQCRPANCEQCAASDRDHGRYGEPQWNKTSTEQEPPGDQR